MMRAILVIVIGLVMNGCSWSQAKLDHLAAVNTALTHEREGLQHSVFALESAYSRIGQDSQALRSSLTKVHEQLNQYEQKLQILEDDRQGVLGKKADMTALMSKRMQTIERQLQVSLVTQDRLDRLVQGLQTKIKQQRKQKVSLKKAQPRKPEIKGEPEIKPIEDNAEHSSSISLELSADQRAAVPPSTSEGGGILTGVDVSAMTFPEVPNFNFTQETSMDVETVNPPASLGGEVSLKAVPDPVVSTQSDQTAQRPVSLQPSHMNGGDQ